MSVVSLSKSAEQVVHDFLNIEIGKTTFACPYFNNRRSKKRAGLRVLIGKGSPTDIAEEVELLGLREKTPIKKLQKKDLLAFLVDHNIGIDCSGFAFYVLAAEVKEKTGKPLAKKLRFPYAGFLRKPLTRLRPVENAGVKTLVHEKNAAPVKIADIAPGDLIYMLSGTSVGSPDHVLVVEKVWKDDGELQKVQYTHSLRWSTDAPTGHGVRRGTIEFDGKKKGLEHQTWKEQAKTGTENETLKRYLDAKDAGLVRLRLLS